MSTRAALNVLGAVLVVWGATAARAAESSESSATEVRITYVGNAGFLIDVGAKKILVDALYRTGVPGYAVHPQELQDQLEIAKPPFDGVSLLLATHVHNDHFDPNAIGRHLVSNKSATLVTTPQSVDRMRQSFVAFSAVGSRVHGLVPNEGDTATVPLDDISLTVLNLHHGRTVPFQNLGFLIEVDGVRLLHAGDTEASQADLGLYGLRAKNIDVAFLPFWYFLDESGLKAVREAIAAKTVIPMHVPVAGAPAVLFSTARDRESVFRVLEALPGMVVFKKEMETKVIPLASR